MPSVDSTKGASDLDQDPEVLTAEKEKRLAELKKSTAEAEKAAAEARKAEAEAQKAWLPTPTTKPLEGTVTSGEGSGAVGAVAAMSLLHDAATKIAENVSTAKAARVLVVDNIELAASDWAHAMVNTQVTRLSAAATRVADAMRAEADETARQAPTEGREAGKSGLLASKFLPGVGAAATAIPALVGAVADVAGYFRSNYNVGKVDISDTSTPLVAAVAAELATKNIETYVDGLSLFDTHTSTVRSFGELLDTRWDLLDTRLRVTQVSLEPAKELLTLATTKRNEARTTAAKDEPPTGAGQALALAEQDLSVAQARVARLQGLVDSATKLEELIDTHVTTMTTVAPDQSMAPLGQAALRDLVHDPQRDIHVLAVSIDHIGTDSINRRSLFGRARVVYVGAAHVSAMLVAPGGQVISASTIASASATRLYLSTGKVVEKPDSRATWERSGAVTSEQRPLIAVHDVPRPAIEPPKATKTARWTLMIFMAGMNNLAAEADRDIAEMTAAEPGGDVEVVVFVKQPTGSRRFRIGGQTETLGDVDSGDPNTVMEFVRWATSVAPAERYALILWNHGTGWERWAYDVDLPVGVRAISTPAGVRKVNSSVFSSALAQRISDPVARQRAILTDDATAHAVDTIELGRLTKAINVHLGRKLDVLAMDACLMSNLEVAYEVRNDVDLVVASEELEPGSGWDYTDLIKRLKQDEDTDAEKWGRHAVTSYIESYRNRHEQVTLSAIRTDGCEPLKDKLDTLAEQVAATMPAGRHRVTDALELSRRFPGHLVDLGQFCKKLRDVEGARTGPSDDAVTSAAEAVRAYLSDESGYVVTQDHSGNSVADVTGVSIYLPARSDPFASTYGDLAFAQGGWDEMIKAFRSAPAS